MNQIIPVDGFEFHVDQNQEPRITSELLASKLGYDNRQGLERLADRHKEMLNKSAVVVTVSMTEKVGATTRTWEIPLYTRKQALYLISKSERPIANELTFQLIEAFDELSKCLTKQVTPEALILAQAQALFDQRQRLDAVQRDLGDVQASVKQLEAAEASRKALEVRAVEGLRTLPEPTVSAKDKPLRASLNECVAQYGLTHGGGSTYSEAWIKIYRELRLRTSFSAVVRAKNSKKGALDVVEEAGLLPQLYAIAREVLRD